MSPDAQREALTVLSELLQLSPDIRLGQLLSHLGFLGEAHLDRGLGYIDDDELIAIMYRHKAELLALSRGASAPPAPNAGVTSVSGASAEQVPG